VDIFGNQRPAQIRLEVLAIRLPVLVLQDCSESEAHHSFLRVRVESCRLSPGEARNRQAMAIIIALKMMALCWSFCTEYKCAKFQLSNGSQGLVWMLTLRKTAGYSRLLYHAWQLAS
jgi:hypothetical protein